MMSDASPLDPADILKWVEEIQTAAHTRGDVEMLWLCHKLRTALADTRRVDEQFRDDVFMLAHRIRYTKKVELAQHIIRLCEDRAAKLNILRDSDTAMATTPRETT